MFKLCLAILVLVAAASATPCAPRWYPSYYPQVPPQPTQPKPNKGNGTKAQILAALQQILANQQAALNNPASPQAPTTPSQDQQILDLLNQLNAALAAQAPAAVPAPPPVPAQG